jgi:hypothetical protein
MIPAQTPDDTIETGKRAPSSLYAVRTGYVLSIDRYSLCPIDHSNGIFSLDIMVFQNLKHLDPCMDAEDPVVSPSFRLGIKMRSSKGWRRIVVSSWSYSEDITHFVYLDAAAKRLGLLHKPVSYRLVIIG